MSWFHVHPDLRVWKKVSRAEVNRWLAELDLPMLDPVGPEIEVLDITFKDAPEDDEDEDENDADVPIIFNGEPR